MIDDGSRVVVPMRFAGVDVLVQATPMTVVGSQPTSAADRVADAYQRAEGMILRIASSVAGTIGQMAKHAASPKQVEVEFGLAVSLEGDIVVVKGATEATLAITLTYDATG